MDVIRAAELLHECSREIVDPKDEREFKQVVGSIVDCDVVVILSMYEGSHGSLPEPNFEDEELQKLFERVIAREASGAFLDTYGQC